MAGRAETQPTNQKPARADQEVDYARFHHLPRRRQKAQNAQALSAHALQDDAGRISREMESAARLSHRSAELRGAAFGIRRQRKIGLGRRATRAEEARNVRRNNHAGRGSSKDFSAEDAEVAQRPRRRAGTASRVPTPIFVLLREARVRLIREFKLDRFVCLLPCVLCATSASSALSLLLALHLLLRYNS